MSSQLFAFLVFASAAQVASPQSDSFPFSEEEPAPLNCVYAGLSPDDRLAARQGFMERVDAVMKDDKKPAKRRKDDASKERDKRSLALSGECQERYDMPNWQMDEWVSTYTNAKNVVEVVRSTLPKGDTDRIDQAVNSLSSADLASLRDRKAKKPPDSAIRLMQSVFQTDKPLDKRSFTFSVLYLESVLKIRDLRIQWADWQKAEKEKARAKAAAKVR